VLVALAASLLISTPARAETSARAEAPGCAPDQPVVCPELGRVVQLVAAGGNTCALTENGTVYCWAAGEPDRRPLTNFPLLLITIGSLLVAGGASLVMISRQ